MKKIDIDKHISTDVAEMIEHLTKNKIHGYESVLELLNDGHDAANLSVFLLEEIKFFAKFAFERIKTNEDKDEMIKNAKVLNLAMNEIPALRIVHEQYMENVNLYEINSNLSEEKSSILKQEMIKALKIHIV